MLPALKHLFANISIWLIVLKYMGLSLATGSSIWATINVLTTTGPDNRKQLTAAGVVSIVLTILGLVISIVSAKAARCDRTGSPDCR
ncbi:hypothetical protein [Mesorhizobium sp. URHB0026]